MASSHTADERELLHALTAFGFDEKEARVYLAGLTLGATSVLELSRRTRLPRTTLYPILEDLRRRGHFKLGKSKRGSVYTAEDPKELDARFRTRARLFADTLPKLEALRGTVHEQAGVTLFEGSDGFRQLWQRIFNSGVTEYRNLTAGVGFTEFVHEQYLVERIVAERVRRGIRSKHLIKDSRTARKIIEQDAAQLRESRLLPSGIDLPASTIIFGNEVVFITTRKENTMTLLSSPESAATLTTMFDLLWEAAERS
ncbi:MAG: helix-turn-helix domain-containing protein [bacterium]|nr:helix-turn-helix domain-containing protein [bacterium]